MPFPPLVPPEMVDQGEGPKLVPRTPPGAPVSPAAGGRARPARRQIVPRRDAAVGGVYVISVASRLLNMHPQTLRKYERVGLVRPSRTEGMLRLYSDGDIARLRMIKDLVDARGMNLAGVEMALQVVNRLLEVRQFLDELPEGQREAQDRIQEALEAMMRLLHFHLPSEPQG